ncbi:uncharacterized protein LOC135399746 [Ornithodoros turicata]|uniref:uncharacterized protein LOC135399746 n=1 Tax=Ornithodoros turicata TaxID=34597 RepID=UPI003138E338
MSYQLPTFEDEKDKWNAYLVRVEAYFEGNNVTGESQKGALLVSALGTRAIEVLSGRVAPRKPNTLSYSEVVNALYAYYNPTPNELSESFRFFNRSQLEGEPIQTFLVEIRRLADNCNFSTMLDRMLRDRIVCGVRSKNVQKELLAHKDLTLQQAEAIAFAAEAADNDAKNLSREQPPDGLHRLKGKRDAGSSKKLGKARECRRCGSSDHSEDNCKFRDATCYKCG